MEYTEGCTITLFLKNVQKTWIREDTLTMLLATPLVLYITYKDIQNNGADDTIKRAMSYMYCTCALPIANANLVDLHQQAGDIRNTITEKYSVDKLISTVQLHNVMIRLQTQPSEHKCKAQYKYTEILLIARSTVQLPQGTVQLMH